MSTLKFTDPDHWARIEQHLREATGERFAFALTNAINNGAEGPVLEVVDVILIDDCDTERGPNGWYLADRALDRVHNQSVTAGTGLMEFHNHHFGPPGFSHMDEAALAPMVAYVLDLLHGTPYGAAVWADGSVRADWWRPDRNNGTRARPVPYRDRYRGPPTGHQRPAGHGRTIRPAASTPWRRGPGRHCEDARCRCRWRWHWISCRLGPRVPRIPERADPR